MLILHTAHSYPPDVSGVAGVVGQISTRLAQRGHEVHVATKVFGTSPAEEVLNGVYVHRFAVKGSTATAISGRVADYLKFVHSKDWDVIGMHCAQSWSTDLLLDGMERIPGAKICITHGLASSWNAEWSCYYQAFAESYRKFDATVALSPLCEEAAFTRHFGLSEPTYIPNGVDKKEIDGADLDMRSQLGIGDAPLVLCLSNHSPLKGHSRFFRVMARLRKKISEARGVIIGKPYRAAKWDLGKYGIKGGCWYKCCASALFRDGVCLLPGLTRSQTISLLKQCDVFMLPSMLEAYPLVILEARAAAVPWVSCDVGCVRENPGGFVVDSEAAMLARTVELLARPDLRRTLGNEGRATLFPAQSWDTIASRYEDLYQGVAAHPLRVALP